MIGITYTSFKEANDKNQYPAGTIVGPMNKEEMLQFMDDAQLFNTYNTLGWQQSNGMYWLKLGDYRGQYHNYGMDQALADSVIGHQVPSSLFDRDPNCPGPWDSPFAPSSLSAAGAVAGGFAVGGICSGMINAGTIQAPSSTVSSKDVDAIAKALTDKLNKSSSVLSKHVGQMYQ